MPLPNPVGLQARVLYLPEKGHYVVLGTAGSGKTTLAILRAAYLAKTHCNKDERVLLVTFNTTLVTYLKTISDNELRQVDVCNYHKFARGYLTSRGKMGRKRNEIVPAETKLELIKRAIQLVKEQYPSNSTFARNPEVFLEEINWLEKMGIRTLEEYEEAERIGRGSTWIARTNRKYFFYVYLKYLELREAYGYIYDYEDIAYYVKTEFENDNTPRLYKHIIIDEGQDFSPTMLQSLVKAVSKDGSLTYFGDVAQQIYGSRISWRSAGFNNPQIWRFNQNYRNIKEIAALGLAISRMPYFPDDTDLVEPLYPKASGPLPVLIKFSSEKEELDFFIKHVISPNRTKSIAILVRDRETVRVVKNIIGKHIPLQELRRDMRHFRSDSCVSVGTYHSAKGLEFDTVILPFCNSKRLPAEERIKALESREEALKEEIKLLYVAVTRAKSELYISYSGEKTELLPDDPSLYQS